MVGITLTVPQGVCASVSVYQVIQWSVPHPQAEACSKAVEVIGEHVRSVDPTAKSFRTYQQVIGPLPLRTYVCLLEYENLTAFDNDPRDPDVRRGLGSGLRRC